MNSNIIRQCLKYPIFLSLLFIKTSIVVCQNQVIDSIAFYIAADSRIYTYCRVNNSDSLSFLIDTGASDMVINSRCSEMASMRFDSQILNRGTTGKNSVAMSSNNVIQWGNQKVENLRFIELSYPMAELDGVMGLSLLRGYIFEINYDTKYIYIYDDSTFVAPNNGEVLSMVYKHNVPFVKAQLSINGRDKLKAMIEVDTGSDRVIDFSASFCEKNRIKNSVKPFAVSTITSSDGNEMKIDNLFIPTFFIAGLVFYKLPVGFSFTMSDGSMGVLSQKDVDGMMGNNFLKRFNQTYDFKNNKLYLQPNNFLYSPFYDFLVK